MKKNLFFAFTFIIIALHTHAQTQTPFIQWQKTFHDPYLGLTGNEIATCMRVTADGGSIVSGFANVDEGPTIKLDSNGNIQWAQYFLNSIKNSTRTYARSIQQTADKGYIIGGQALILRKGFSFSDDDDYWVVKLDSLGNKQWEHTYGDSAYDDVTQSIIQTKDEGYILTGSTYNFSSPPGMDVTVVKLDSDGNLQWRKKYGGSASEEANSIIQTTDGGYILAGYTESNDGDVSGNHSVFTEDYWIVKLDDTGNIQWQKCFGGTNNDMAKSIVQTAAGDYVIAGTSWSNDGDVTGSNGAPGDYWIIKISGTGNLIWQKAYGGSKGDVANSLQQTADGGYVVAGYTFSKDDDISFAHRHYDEWIVKLNSGGALEWQRTLGGRFDDQANAIDVTKDGGFMVAGYTASNGGDVTNNYGGDDYWVVKLSPDKLNDGIRLNPYHIASNCSASNSISCTVNSSAPTTVYLYKFDALYDSAVTVAGHVGFHDLPSGAYYAKVFSGGGSSTSDLVSVIPVPVNLTTSNIQSTQAQLSWAAFDCADRYRIEYKKQTDTEWQIVRTDWKKNTYVLQNLIASTNYVWRVAAWKTKDGINATGGFSDSLAFTTSGPGANDALASSLHANNVTAFPNPAKNSITVQFNAGKAGNNRIELNDISGRSLQTKTVTAIKGINKISIDVSNYTPGMYMITLTDDDHIKRTLKFTKE